MTTFRWIACLAAVVATLGSFAVVGLIGPTIAFSQNGSTIVTNTSGRPLQVVDGVTGQPVSFGGQPWLIEPGQSFYSFPWNDSSRFVFGGTAYHYIGSVPGSRFQFFIVEDWLINSGQAPLPPLATATPTPVPATPTPTTPFVNQSVSYLPNCGLTQVKGRIVNPDGNGRGGVRVRVSSGDWSAISNPSNNDGHWDVLLDSKPKPGVWDVQVWDNGPQSEVVRVETNTSDCGPSGSGRQVAVIDFRKLTY